MPLYVLPCPNVAKGQSCTPCEDLAVLNQEISDVEKLLAMLKSKRRSVYERMNHAHDPLTSKLPAEVLSKIFTILLPGNVHGEYNIDLMRPQKDTMTPFLLGAVCGFWRAIAWSTPQLWTSISVRFSDTDTTLLNVFRECLIRSGRFLPLYLRLKGSLGESKIAQEITGQFIDEFNSYSERWFDLDIKVSPKLLSRLYSSSTDNLMLNTLKISIYGVDNQSIDLNLGRAFGVRNLSMYPLRLEGFNLPWQNLTNVNVTIQSIDVCFALFSKAPSMTHCTVYLDIHNNPHTTRNAILRHDHLIFLRFDDHVIFTSETTNAFFSWMELPALKHLIINADDDIDPGALQHLLSNCSLKTFEVNLRCGEYERRIIPLLEAMPSLETLELHGSSHQEHSLNTLLKRLSQPALTLSHATMFLPNLRSLRVKDMQVSWTCLYDVVFAHSEDTSITMPAGAKSGDGSEYVRPLRSLHIGLSDLMTMRHPFKIQPIELDMAPKIQRAIERGFEVTLVVKERWNQPRAINFLEDSLYSLSGI